jgi:hypothetical protein
MPALFAYLISLCLLLGAGAGALNWLAAPEPLKVAAKASPKSKLSSQPVQARPEKIAAASLPTTSLDSAPVPEPSSSADIDKAASASIDPPAPREAGTRAATVDRDAPPDGVTPAPDPQARSAHAEITADEATPAEKAIPAKPAPRVLTASASSTADNAARPSKRHRQASSRPEKRKLELMTLRTIQFDDGRRVTQLIPYRGRERALAFGDDD